MIKLMVNVDPEELKKFSRLKNEWWDRQGKLKTLHDINPPRIEFIKQNVSLEDKRLLDVGCGGGILSEALAKEGANVTACDLEKNAIGVARAHAKQANLAIDYHHLALEDLDIEPFELATCYEMLEHVPCPQTLVTELSKKLTLGGKLFLSTINRNAKSYAFTILGAEYLLNLLPRQTHDYKKFIRPSELATMARKADLHVERVTGLHYNPLTRTASLTDDVSINFLMMCRKEGN